MKTPLKTLVNNWVFWDLTNI